MITNYESLSLAEVTELRDSTALQLEELEQCIASLETDLDDHKQQYNTMLDVLKKLHSIVTKQRHAS